MEVGEKPCERERGGKREGKGNPRDEGNKGRGGRRAAMKRPSDL